MSEKQSPTPPPLRDSVSITNELDQLRRQPGFYKSAAYLIRQQLEAHAALAIAAERERIVKALRQANLISTETLPSRGDYTHPNSCNRCGYQRCYCVCKSVDILRIVNPDAETGT